mmetsp:Transcript_3620/g.11309  ORF Transcript_3620/g.11309 Transcript_3620/m.11309 type:complete len:385 (+) Transcript_3620:63-1217(+)
MSVASESVQVGRKVSSVKWLSGFAAAELGADSRLLASGTWDDRENRLQVWMVEGPKRERFAEKATLASPTLLHTVSIQPSITAIEALPENRLVVSTGDGAVHLYYLDEVSLTPTLRRSWEGLHRPMPNPAVDGGPAGPDHQCECTAVAAPAEDGEHIATGGEDGVINYFGLDMLEVRSPDEYGRYRVNWSTSENGELGDCAIRSIAFRNRDELLSGDSLGQLQQWDTRQKSSLGAVVTMHSEQKHSVINDIAVHPSHNYSVAAADGDGSVVIWDVRHPVYPQSNTAAHRADVPEVWKVRFNPVRPDHLFTAGEDGALVHWDTSGGDGAGLAPPPRVGRSFAIGGDVDVKGLTEECLGINALDVEPELVAYGCDEEKLVVVVPAY